MRTHPNELFFYYHNNHNSGKQVKVYAQMLSKHINEVNLELEKITPTGWQKILDQLDLRPKDLLNRAHPDYQTHIAGRTWDDEGWLNILSRFSYLIKAPIAVMKDKAVLCTSPGNILRLI